MLFEPFAQRSLTLRNRIVVSPMCQYSSPDGVVNDWHLVHLGSFATGGAALVLTEATAVSLEGRISPIDAGIWNDYHLEAWKKITKFVRAQGAVIGIQLAHAGRKAGTDAPWRGGTKLPESAGGWQAVAPSPIPFREDEPSPAELDAWGIAKIKRDFRAATLRAVRAGFQLIELHAAHGYLFHQFLSPLSNHRSDAYGGSFDNRVRLLVEVAEETRALWPAHLPLWVRISGTDWLENDEGWTLAQSVELAKRLKMVGADLIDVSSGGNALHAKIPVAPNYQVPLADRIKLEAQIPTGAVGLITTPTQANDILKSGHADVILLAREMLRDPHWPSRAAKELGAPIPAPNQYVRAW